MALTTYDPAPIELTNPREHARQLADVANRNQTGKWNNLVEVTLTADQATTTISSPLIGPFTKAVPISVSESAGGELGMYQDHPNATLGEIVLHHGTDSRTDRSFIFMLVG